MLYTNIGSCVQFITEVQPGLLHKLRQLKLMTNLQIVCPE